MQATLLELTAVTIVEALHGCCPQTAHLLVCGGGVHNPVLMARIAALLPELRTSTTAAAGLDPDWVEATAFAWSAWRTLNGHGIDLTGVTGARKPVILGGIYPA